MKKFQLTLKVFAVFFLLHSNVFPQLLKIQNFIGRSQLDLINELGEPVSFDDSNPSMICMSYNFMSIKCLADKDGIYYAELTRNYTSEREAFDDIKDYISYSIPDGYTVDSISTDNYILKKGKTQADIEVTELKDTPYFKLKIKAVRKKAD